MRRLPEFARHPTGPSSNRSGHLYDTAGIPAQPTFDLELPGVFARICTQQRTREPFSVLDDKDILGAVRGGDRVREGPLAHRIARAGCNHRGGDCEPPA